MAENINIASFDFDNDKVMKSLIDLKNEMSRLKTEISNTRKENAASVKEYGVIADQMKRLKDAGKETSKEYQNYETRLKQLTAEQEKQNKVLIQNENQLKKVSNEYKVTSDVFRSLTDAEGQYISAKEKANQLIEEEIKTITQARQSNQEILLLRNNLNASVKEGVALNEEELKTLQDLNAKLDENNAFIKENSSAYEQQKINIGNYTESINEALSAINPFNGGLTGFIDRSKAAGGVGNLLTQSLKQLVVGIRAVTVSSLAFIATPVGAVITAIVLAVTLLYNIFKGFTPIMDKVEQGMAAIGAVVNVVKNAIIGLITGAKSLGDVFKNLGGDMRDAAKAAAELKKAQQDLEDAMQGQEIQNEKIKGQIEALIIAAKDRTKSDEDRLAMLEKAEKLEKENFKQRKEIAAEDLRIATEQIKLKAGITSAELKELRTRYSNESDFFNAFKEMAEERTSDVEELFETFQKSLTGYYSTINEHNKFVEQTINQTNKVLEKAESDREKAEREAEKRRQEADQKAQKAFDDRIQKMNEELDLWIAQQGERARTLEEQITIERKIAEDSIKILNYELKSKKISITKYNTEVLKIQNDLSRRQAELVAQNAEDELNEWLRTNQSILADENRLNEELILAEERRLNQYQQMRINFEQERLAEGIINEREYQQQVLGITEETEAEKAAIQKRYADQLRAEAIVMRQLQFEEDLLRLQQEGATEFELMQAERDSQYQLELERINEEREQNIISEDEYLQRLSNIETKWNIENAKAQEQIEKLKQETKMQLASQAFGLMAEILGQETAAGKAAAIAQTTIDTYSSAVSAYNSMSGIPIIGPALGAVAAGLAIATGLMNVKKIVSTKTPKISGSVGGYATGGRIANGVSISRPNGDNVLITAKRGEVILNQEQQARAGGSPFFAALGVPGFATGGVVGGPPMLPSQSSFVQQQLTAQVNTDAIRDAVREGAMEGSLEGSLNGSRQGASEGTNTGFRDLSTDRQILDSYSY